MAKRRGHGEGAIYQRESDGKWCANVDLGWQNGKRQRKVVYGKTRKEVAEKLRALQRDQAAGINLLPEQQTVQQFLEHWLEHSVKRLNRPRTYIKYKSDVEHYLVPHIGKHALTKLTPDHVQVMLNSAGTSGLSPRSVSNLRAVLRKALNIALRRGYVQRNVATLVDAPRSTTFTVKPLNEEEARRLLDQFRGHRLEALYRLALSLGLRRGEVCGLRWEDVDFTSATIRVSGSLQRYGGKLQRDAPKTVSSLRTIALPRILLKVLREHQAHQEHEGATAEEWTASGYVFVSVRGTPLEPHNVVRTFKKALEAAELPTTIRFHDLRHSCATLLIAQGVNHRVVMDILGHTQISTTMNTYAHVLPATQRQAVEEIDRLFGDTPGKDEARKDEEGAPATSEEGEGDVPTGESGLS